jgi:hypothetical protein
MAVETIGEAHSYGWRVRARCAWGPRDARLHAPQRTPSRFRASPVMCYRAAIAAVAQPVEHRIRNAGVGGSNPFRGTIFLAQERGSVAVGARRDAPVVELECCEAATMIFRAEAADRRLRASDGVLRSHRVVCCRAAEQRDELRRFIR